MILYGPEALCIESFTYTFIIDLWIFMLNLGNIFQSHGAHGLSISAETKKISQPPPNCSCSGNRQGCTPGYQRTPSWEIPMAKPYITWGYYRFLSIPTKSQGWTPAKYHGSTVVHVHLHATGAHTTPHLPPPLSSTLSLGHDLRKTWLAKLNCPDFMAFCTKIQIPGYPSVRTYHFKGGGVVWMAWKMGLEDVM